MSSFKKLIYFGLVLALVLNNVKAEDDFDQDEEEEEESFECQEAIMDLRVNGVCTTFRSCCFDPSEGCSPGNLGCFMPNNCIGDANCVFTTNVCEACIADSSSMYSNSPCPVNNRRL